MTLKLLYLSLILSAININAQSNLLDDTASEKGQTIQKLINTGISPVSVRTTKSSRKLQGYRLCEHNYVEIQFINQHLTDEEIEILINSDNGTLKAVGFIVYANRNRDKSLILKKLTQVLESQYVLMTRNCSDAISTLSLGRFDYELLTINNIFFRSDFKLNKNEKKFIEEKLALYESDFK